MTQKRKYFLLVSISLLSGWLLTSFLSFPLIKFTPTSAPASGPVRLGKGYELINPLLLCNASSNREFAQFKPLKDKVQAVINNYLKNQEATNVSVYYMSLNTGHWFGINENDTYSPASLLKVPMLIAYLKATENNPKLLEQSAVYDGSADANFSQAFPPKLKMQKGQSYTVLELLENAIVYSSNSAELMLHKELDQNIVRDVFTDLQLPLPSAANVDYMSAKLYSYFFRVLYNGSYLNKDSSEKALEILSRARFDKGIAAAVPLGVKVAEKFGERGVIGTKGKPSYKELHDCGIIYTSNPYMLCVMTKGDDFNKLSDVIVGTSKTIYDNNNI